MDYKVYDLSKKLTETQSLHSKSNVIIVDIDEKSLTQLGQWPWSRVILTQLLNEIQSYYPSSIGFDIIFPEKDRTSPVEILAFYKKYFHINTEIVGISKNLQDNDLLFAHAIQRSNSVLSVYMSDTKSINSGCKSLVGLNLDENTITIENSPYILCNTPVLNNATKHFGFINTTIDDDGILRRMTLLKKYTDIQVPTLGLAMLLNIDANINLVDANTLNIFNHPVKFDKNLNVLLNFYKDKWYKKVSAIDILTHNVPSSMLQGKIVIIGSSAVALHDQVVTSGGRNLAGVLVHVTLIDNILNNQLLVQPQEYKKINLLISFLIFTLIIFLLYKEKNIYTIVLFIVSVIISLFVNFKTLEAGVYISYGYFIIPLLVHFFLITLVEIVMEIFERRIFEEELNKSHIALLDSMVHVAEVHDIETGSHIIRTKEYVRFLAKYLYKNKLYPKGTLTPDKIEIMYRTAPLHDIGKVGIPDSILKKEGKLTPMEFEVMKTHPVLGKHIINNAINSYTENSFFEIGRNIAMYHHEKWDGTGYPDGLAGEEIPIESRLMALADVYDALINKRVYKEAFSYEETIKIITDGRGVHFDPIIVDAFLACQNEFKIISELYADSSDE